jgi:subtilisin family serine protease
MIAGSTSQSSADLARHALLAGPFPAAVAASAFLVLMFFSPGVSATTVVAGVKARPAPTSMVKPVARRGANFRPLVGKLRERRLQRAKKSADWSKPSRRRPDRPRDPDRPDKPRDRDWPRRPPFLVLPATPGEFAAYARSLPKRAERRPPQAAPPRVAREIVALIDATQPQSLGGELAQAYGLQLLTSRPIALLGARVELFRVRSGRSDTAALAVLQGDPRVRSAQFNQRYLHGSDGQRQAATIPQYGPRNVRAPEAHQLALGRNVLVGVIDSEIDEAHPDLKGAVVRSFDAVGGPDAAPDFHGTAVAGIIRARGIVEGVAPQAGILAVRAFRARRGLPPETTTEYLLVAIDWAVGNGARVINLSFVGARDAALAQLLQKVQEKRIVLVAAAGNAGPKAPPAYPAAYPGVIAVTAVDEADRRYRHANRGHYVAVAAPGVDILAPVERGRHAFLSGTSFATAYVSGIAALVLERDPTVDTQAIAELIAGSADDLGPPGRDDDFGAGRINALAALKSVRAVAARSGGPE